MKRIIFKKSDQELKSGDIVIRTKERSDGRSHHGQVGQAMKIISVRGGYSKQCKCYYHRVELLAPKAGQFRSFDLLEDRMKKI